MKKIENDNVKDYNKLYGKAICPNCGSYDTFANNNNASTGCLGSITFIVGGSLCLWIPFLGWFLSPICFIIAILLFLFWVYSLINVTYVFKCRKCDTEYNMSKKEFNNLTSKE